MKRFACAAAALALAVVPFTGCSGDSAPQGSGSSASLTTQQLDASSSEAEVQESQEEPSTQEPTSSSVSADDTHSADAANAESAAMEAIREYARSTYGMTGDIIVAGDVVSLDDSNADDVVAYGYFGAYSFEKDGNVFVMQSAAQDTGAVHLAQASDGSYTATSVAYAEDGAGHDESLQQICAGNDGVYEQLSTATVSDEELKSAVIDYVQTYGIDVNAYEMPSGERVEL